MAVSLYAFHHTGRFIYSIQITCLIFKVFPTNLISTFKMSQSIFIIITKNGVTIIQIYKRRGRATRSLFKRIKIEKKRSYSLKLQQHIHSCSGTAKKIKLPKIIQSRFITVLHRLETIEQNVPRDTLYIVYQDTRTQLKAWRDYNLATSTNILADFERR